VVAVQGALQAERSVGIGHSMGGVVAMTAALAYPERFAPLTPKLAALEIPVLLLVGEQDPMGSKASELLLAALPEGRAELHRFAGRGHWLHVEAVDEVVAVLDEWLERNSL
jgi:pimeloyl-ACP methyl ester carboxylesterase